jgi:hypothetical protein
MLEVGPENADRVLLTLGAHGRDVDGQEVLAVAHVAGVDLVAAAVAKPARFQNRKLFIPPWRNGGVNRNKRPDFDSL